MATQNRPSARDRIVVVLGTRPEAVKLIPVLREIASDGRLEGLLVLTGQHREIVDQMLRPFDVPVYANLDIMRETQSLNDILARTIPRLDSLYEELRPKLLIVQGDTSSAFAAALTAFHRGIPVAHVEAGLRSHDRFHPYPEEVNRRMLSAVTDLHLAPTRQAAANLVREGVDQAAIFVTGNTAIDSLLMALASTASQADDKLPEIDADRPVVLITLHRRETWTACPETGDIPLRRLLGAIARVAVRHPHVAFVYPVHPNPVVRQQAREVLGTCANAYLVDPVPYIPFTRLMARAACIVTDSGGVQEEAPSLGVPVLVLRKTTERPEGLRPGMNRLVGMDGAAIEAELSTVLSTPRPPPAALPCANPFGDGRAARRIVLAVLHFLGAGERPDEFVPTAC